MHTNISRRAMLRGSAGVGDDLDALETWAARLATQPQVRWATIAETAEAWLAQGAIPSRIKL